VSSGERAELEKQVAEAEEATEQGMHLSLTGYREAKRSTSVQIDYLRGHRSTTAELSAAVPMSRNTLTTRQRTSPKAMGSRVPSTADGGPTDQRGPRCGLEASPS
jgi:hypothetical protein